MNPHRKIPLWFGEPASCAGWLYALRAIVAGLLILSGFAWSGAIGYWAMALVLLGIIPTLVLNSRHNRRVERTAKA